MTDKILLVDDEPLILSGYRRSLRKRFRVDTAQGGAEALAAARSQGPYAVVVSDMRMPEMDGLELLSRMRELSPDTVRIMLTGNADQQTAAEAVNRGQVLKFLNKPCPAEMLADALEEGVALYRARRERQRQLEHNAAAVKGLTAQLDHQSRHDAVTGLANRSSFQAGLATLVASLGERSGEHALACLDLDHFQVINNACGHPAGDALLRQVGALLSERAGGTVARLSGDSFGLLLEGCTLEAGGAVLEDVLEAVRRLEFAWEGRHFAVTASAGLVPVNRVEAPAEALLGAAETACDVAKDGGRNRLHVATAADPELKARLSQAHWVARIHEALEAGRFRLHQQTIAPLDPTAETGHHFELLIRLIDEDGRVLPPGEFLPAVERFHLSRLVDRWVIGTAVAWLGDHPQVLERLALCSINLSGHSLGDPELLGFIREAFARSPVPPSRICFEVTETAAILHLQEALALMGALKADGFRFALDDFGTGFSSFAYLRSLPVDYLKIDGMFVRHLDQDPVDRAMVKAINEIGHLMGMRTIAEYVENGAIEEQLRSLGVDFAQGYHLARPEPLEALTRG